MLLHICDSGGQPISGMTPKVTGSTSNWTNLGTLLKAGIKGVKDVDTGILISFHIDRGNAYSTTKNWLDNAIKQGATPDAFGESCYQSYQGDSSSTANTKSMWQSTFSQLVTAYPSIRFFAAEYGPMEREINDVLFGLPNNQGLGTFDWEPTTQGSWNAKQASLAALGEHLQRAPRPGALPAHADRLREPAVVARQLTGAATSRQPPSRRAAGWRSRRCRTGTRSPR
jgi:hypothetical protein